MKKSLTSGLIILSMVFAPTLRADDALDAPETEVVEEEDTGTVVGQGSNEGAKAARNRQWQNIAIAVGAVAVAVTALVLVASNDGHK